MCTCKQLLSLSSLMQFSQNKPEFFSNESQEKGSLRSSLAISSETSPEITTHPSTPRKTLGHGVTPAPLTAAQPISFMSLFSSRQRKTSTMLSTISVKQSRLSCIAKIEESLKSSEALIEFFARFVKAETKVSNALWRTVQYSKSRKYDVSDRKLSSVDFGRVLPPSGAANCAASSGDSSAVDSGISETVSNNAPSLVNGHRTHTQAPYNASQAMQVFLVIYTRDTSIFSILLGYFFVPVFLEMYLIVRS